MTQLIVFDLDGTLAESKTPIDAEMATLLGALLAIVKVAVISGGDWPQFGAQLLANLRQNGRLENLSLLPTCGTKFYQYDAGWRERYAENLTPPDTAKIRSALTQALAACGYTQSKVWGPLIEDRGTQITFSALGQEAPIEEKKKWDPDFSKRKRIAAALHRSLPDFAVHLGGTTSIDVTRPGIDKGYGIRKLETILQIPIRKMIFLGDALFPGGNDYPAQEAGAPSIRVRDPHETKRVIEALIACLSEVEPQIHASAPREAGA